MKTIFRSFLAVVAYTCLLAVPLAQAQTFPNSTLDNWALRFNAIPSGVDSPTNWQTTDDLYSAVGLPLPFSTGTITKAPVARSGPFAAQLQTMNYLGNTATVAGALFLGNRFHGGGNLPGGLPFTARPANLQFYYQLSGARAVSDSAGVQMEFRRHVGNSTVVVARASYMIPALAASYTLANVPIRYLSSLAPDSVSLVFCSGFITSPTLGTVMRIDDIAFTGTATATRNPALAAAISLSPNPSPDGHYILGTTEAGLLAAPIAVLDLTGRVVRHEAALSQVTATRYLDLSELPVGIYTLQLATPCGLVTRKVIR